MKDKLKKHRYILEEVADKIASNFFYSPDLPDLFSSFKNIGGNIWLFGAGKASVEMALQAERYFGSAIKDGIIISPQKTKVLKRAQVFEGAHPYPDQNSVSASYELCKLAKNVPEEDAILFCLSGGASSLFCIPAKGIELDELAELHRLLLNSGASIHEINVVRKHLSETAGGKFGRLLSTKKLISIILSDVPGDDPEVIGSGPTVPDSSTFKEAFQVLKQYQLWEKVSHSSRIHISKGMHGDLPETPKPNERDWKAHRVEVISGAEILARNVGKYLKGKGYHVQVSPEAYNMELNKISKKICSEAISILGKKTDLKEPAALIYFGESTVQVEGKGKGGRNLELTLNAAISIEGQHPVSLLSFATDGIDGPTDAAGAIINSQTTLDARKKKLMPEDYLQNNDSYNFHTEMETLLKTGPTGNNLMDLQVALVG